MNRNKRRRTISTLQIIFQKFASNITYLIESMEDTVFEDLIKTRDLLNYLQSIGKNLQKALKSYQNLVNGLGLLPAYCFVLISSFFLSIFLIPDLFFTMISVTFIFVFIQNKIPINIQQILITKQTYYLLWFIIMTVILVLQYWPKIKRKIFPKNEIYNNEGSYHRLYTVSK